MRLPRAFLFLLLLGAASPPEPARWPHEIAGLVLAAANADLQAATGLDYLQVAEKLFAALPAEPSSEDLWRTLYRVRGMAQRSPAACAAQLSAMSVGWREACHRGEAIVG